MNQEEPKPQLEQPYYYTMSLRLCILENGPKWLLVITSRISKSGFVEEGRKRFPIDACLSTVFTLFSYHFSFFNLSVISLLVLSAFLPWFLPYLWPLPLFIMADLMELLPFTPRTLPTVFGLR